ncbi:unannotated protein [freshwater metagenome]|uniref:Unannotated protein n=1 Tax=freshwater metagenome TaxID=449393 RepID=A0A6J5YAB5_9ZZZZ
MEHAERNQREREAECEQVVTVINLFGEPWCGEENGNNQHRGENSAEPDCPNHEGSPSLSLRFTMGERTGDLLLEWQEETRTDHEDNRPER